MLFVCLWLSRLNQTKAAFSLNHNIQHSNFLPFYDFISITQRVPISIQVLHFIACLNFHYKQASLLVNLSIFIASDKPFPFLFDHLSEIITDLDTSFLGDSVGSPGLVVMGSNLGHTLWTPMLSNLTHVPTFSLKSLEFIWTHLVLPPLQLFHGHVMFILFSLLPFNRILASRFSATPRDPWGAKSFARSYIPLIEPQNCWSLIMAIN